MGFSRQEHGSGLPFPPPGDLPHPGIKPKSPASPALSSGLYHYATWEAHTELGQVLNMRVSLSETENNAEKRFIRRERPRREGYCHKPEAKLEPPEAERQEGFFPETLEGM